MVSELILGTAGHIDHGKTSLVRALTGTDTDRLPEEKRRGITIELGFARLELGEHRLGVVDVPGHERFVRQMLAGATSVNLALLVVAADDSVKPQTVEHLDILRFLDVPVGVIALTKCDLVDEDWLDLVEEEIRELVQDSFLSTAPIVRTSITTGEGIDNLRDALHAAATVAARPMESEPHQVPFRMGIDRCFSIDGHGTVVTGSVASGTVRVGDELVIQPQGLVVRVRGLQNHDEVVGELHRGQRAAINLAGVHHHEVTRGFELASPGHLVPTNCIIAKLELLPSAPRPLKHRTRVRLHVGTTEVHASLLLPEPPIEMRKGDERTVQFLLRDPTTVVWNQPFIIRAESPVQTIGGGRVLVPNSRRLRKLNPRTQAALVALREHDAAHRAAAAVELLAWIPWQSSDLVRLAGILNYEDVVDELVRSGELIKLNISPQRIQTVHRHVLEEACERIRLSLESMHREQPLKNELDRSMLLGRLASLGEPSLLLAILQHMHDRGILRFSGKGVSLAAHRLHLSEDQLKLRKDLLSKYKQAWLEPPTMEQMVGALKKPTREISSLTTLLVESGELVHVGGDVFMHREAEAAVRDMLRTPLSAGGMTLSEIRELLGTTRKYAVPLCEYLDRIGYTKRQGDLRTLAAGK